MYDSPLATLQNPDDAIYVMGFANKNQLFRQNHVVVRYIQKDGRKHPKALFFTAGRVLQNK